ncbi:hypothetical protein B0I26_11311 [Anoxybacillus vitaminiphilus]|uniref:ABC-type transport system involved in multi-copper enzyme maturation permease subunit n=1 Tax=Paranoxybacillus vitaminiphilus TaxID=581036 RepID=A0A327Y9H7_9BACL|nr:hypothetical protein [Anoxybacillus vitaminiphilus]RAK17147.1 hypothetical protein B0I26_11311 [Anoxybacillus vitaminiphilus]
MNVWRFELKKAFQSPVVSILIMLFLFFNFWLIYNHAGIREELKVTNQLVERFGYKIDAEMSAKLQAYYQSKLQKMNELTRKKFGKTYERAGDFFSEYEYRSEVLSEEELHVITETAIVEGYYELIQEVDQKYSHLDLSKKAKADINKYGLSGKTAEVTREYYKKLNNRLDELIEAGEHKNLFFIGYVYRMHSFLFKDLMRQMIFEVMILVVLITGHVTTYEFQNQTHLTSYASKRGRKLMLDKLVANLLATLCISSVILGATLLVYFLVFDYSGLWGIPISSFFNNEFPFPYISWWKLPFGIYLSCVLVVFIICQLFFTVITYSIAVWIKNNYLVYAAFALLFGLCLLVPGIVPNTSSAIFWTRYTPFELILNPHLWFIGWNVFFPKNYIWMTSVIWTCLLAIVTVVTFLKFNKEQID